MTKIEVYSHFIGRKTIFDFRFDARASVAGAYELHCYDEQYFWTYFPTSNLSFQPSSVWISEHVPQGKGVS